MLELSDSGIGAEGHEVERAGAGKRVDQGIRSSRREVVAEFV